MDKEGLNKVDAAVPEIIEKPSDLVDQMLGFVDTMNHPDYETEVTHLEKTLEAMEREIEKLENAIEETRQKQKEVLTNCDSESRRELYIFSNLQKTDSEYLLKIENVLDSPYFGRIDIREDNSDEIETFYLGEVGFKQGSEYGVIDWRNPIGSLFYEGETGRVKYKAPGGEYSGELKLRRQYDIRNSKLIYFSDDVMSDKIIDAINSDTSLKQEAGSEDLIADPFLLHKLTQNAGKNLKNIVKTIRAEQNKIIRQDLNKVLVVQGAAGSGKSTVGLHRISYILYNYKGIKPDKILVVVPNRIFLDYISEILPKIDIKGVTQTTFEELAFSIIGSEYNIFNDEKVNLFLNAPEKNLLYRFLKDVTLNISKFKGSLSFINLIDYIINEKTNEIIDKLTDISLFGDRLNISREEQIGHLKSEAPLNYRIETIKHTIKFKVNNFLEQEAFHMKDTTVLKQEADVFLKKYLKNINQINPISLYKELYEDDYIYKALYKNRYFSSVAQYTLKLLEVGCVEREDLAPLCYIKYRVDGIKPEQKHMHIFVDEAQDLSLLEFAVLKLILENNSMTIMGDMNQGINYHRGINDWKDLIDKVFKESKPTYFEILNSYRPTKEIVEFSNRLIPENLPKAIPVPRNGEEPKIEKIESFENGIIKLKETIKYCENRGWKSIGILAKNKEQCSEIYSALSKSENEIENLTLLDDTVKQYNGGISIIPITLSKGLEFDAVLLWGTSDKNFSGTDFNLKNLYVAVTRAMHYLHIFYMGNITSHLYVADNAVSKEWNPQRLFLWRCFRTQRGCTTDNSWY